MNTHTIAQPVIAHEKGGTFSTARGCLALLKYSPPDTATGEPAIDIHPVANFVARAAARFEVDDVPFVRIEGLGRCGRYFKLEVPESLLSNPRGLWCKLCGPSGAGSTIYVGQKANFARYLRGTMEVLSNADD